MWWIATLTLAIRTGIPSTLRRTIRNKSFPSCQKTNRSFANGRTRSIPSFPATTMRQLGLQDFSPLIVLSRSLTQRRFRGGGGERGERL